MAEDIKIEGKRVLMPNKHLSILGDPNGFTLFKFTFDKETFVNSQEYFYQCIVNFEVTPGMDGNALGEVEEGFSEGSIQGQTQTARGMMTETKRDQQTARSNNGINRLTERGTLQAKDVDEENLQLASKKPSNIFFRQKIKD